MTGGSSKLGRGRGRGGMTRRFSAPQQSLRASIPSGGRVSEGPKNRNTGPASADPHAVEETFSLVSGNNPLAFAMMIKLPPDLVEEIRRAEAQGETAKIKFDANPKNPASNLINVGGKEFRFTWSKELGDLCDIYEEKQSSEDGNGLLVETGCAWRKLNVQRILDESTTNHVKMLSKEAERKNKARKAIVLDNGNPSMKNQIKQLAAVEATSAGRMGFKRKEPPPKKRKVDPLHVSSGRPVKSAYVPRLTSNSKTAGKGGRAISPLASPQDQFQASVSPSCAANISKSNAITVTEDAGPSGQLNREDTTVSEREISTKPTGMAPRRSGDKVDLCSKPMDLQSMLISILRDNPKGMSIKALEKAIGYAIPNSGKKFLSRIATYQAPGRYLLKPGVELEAFKGPSPRSGSSFEDIQVPAYEENVDETSVPEPTSPKDVPSINGLVPVKPSVQGKLDASENVDIEQHSADLFGVKQNSDHINGRADSSSESGSDSDGDSDSSDSRSDSGSSSRSGSRNRSKSPIRSGSNSNRDSDASSNQEGSDEDVDIMTSDDDKGLKHNAQDLGPAFPVSPVDDGILDIDGADEKHDGHDSDIVHIDVIEEGDYRHGTIAEETNHILSSYNESLERQNFTGSLFNGVGTASEDNFKHEKLDSSGRASRDQTRREYDSRYSCVKTEQVKILKTESYCQPAVLRGSEGHCSLRPCELSASRCNVDLCQSPAGGIPNRADEDMNDQSIIQKGSQVFPGKSSLHSQELSHGSYDQGFSASTTCDVSGRPSRQAENLSQRHLPMQKERSVGEAQCEGYGAAERGRRGSREGSSGGKHSLPSVSLYDKPGETRANNLKEIGTASMQVGSSRKSIDRTGIKRPSLVNGRGDAMMQRELSGLEFGDLCPEEASLKRPFEREGSFKQSENKSIDLEKQSKDPGRGKPPGKSTIDLGKPSPPNLYRKRTLEHREDDPVVPVQQGVQSQLEYLSNEDHGGSEQMCINVSKSTTGPQQLDAKQDSVSQSIKESETLAASIATNMSNGQQAVSADCDGVLKRRECSSDENSCSYSKYEKDEPELKGPIKDLQQYFEYAQEYYDKYDSYCSINKILENYRNEFERMGKELCLAKGRDLERYNHVKAELRDSYSVCGLKHKRLKKIFVVLHVELRHLKQMMIEFVKKYSKGSD